MRGWWVLWNTQAPRIDARRSPPARTRQSIDLRVLGGVFARGQRAMEPAALLKPSGKNVASVNHFCGEKKILLEPAFIESPVSEALGRPASCSRWFDAEVLISRFFSIWDTSLPAGFITEIAALSRAEAAFLPVYTAKVVPSCPPRRGAHSPSRRRNDLLPLSLRRASPAAPCTRCATTVCAAARRAQPH